MPVTKEEARENLDRENIAVVSDAQLTAALASVDQAPAPSTASRQHTSSPATT